jgi:hypothetical protein
MKKYFHNIVLIFFTSLLFFSCTIKGNFKGLYSYYDKTKSEKPELLISLNDSTSIFHLKQSTVPKIYVINGSQIKECINNSRKSVVYIWGPKCSSKICIPLEILQREANTKGVELYIVAEYYDTEKMEMKYDIVNPIFGIDVKYYKSSLTSKYLSKFIYDLIEKEDISNNRYFYFEEGNFINSYNSIDLIP